MIEAYLPDRDVAKPITIFSGNARIGDDVGVTPGVDVGVGVGVGVVIGVVGVVTTGAPGLVSR